MAPGGPFDSDRAPGDAQVEENLKAVYNLDAPLYEQYFDYMSGVLEETLAHPLSILGKQ